MIRKVAAATGLVLLLALLLLAVAILWPVAAAPLPYPAQSWVLRNVRVVDVERGAASHPLAVTVRDGIIASVGDADPGLPSFDARGAWLVPGFWDMHVHSFQLSPQLHLPLMLANGVTGVRDMMDCPEPRDSLIACAADKREWNRAAAAGTMASPRFVSVASYYLEGPALTTGQVTARARAAAARGVDELKVYNRISPAAYRHASQEARRNGLRLVGHLPKAVALDEALAAGQRSFEHAHLFARHCFDGAGAWRAGRLDGGDPVSLARRMVASHDPAVCSRAFTAMKAAGATFVPTHVTREEDARAGEAAFLRDPSLAFLDPLSRWAWRDDRAATRAAYPGAAGEAALRAYFEHGLRLTGAAHRAGVPILVGTDSGPAGLRYHDELALLVRAGLTPAAALRAATIDAARYSGLDAQFGTIESGKQADLVLLDANPLADITATRRIRAVAIAGRIYDREGLDRLLVFSRGQAARPDMPVKLLWGFARSGVASDF